MGKKLRKRKRKINDAVLGRRRRRKNEKCSSKIFYNKEYNNGIMIERVKA